MSTWLALALGLVQLINMVMTRLDAAEKEKAMKKLLEADFLKQDLAAIARARDALNTKLKELGHDEAKIKEPDKDMRP